MSDTPLEDAIIEFLQDWKKNPENDGNSPTYEQIAAAVGRYPANVSRAVNAMHRKGMVRINKYRKICLNGKYILPDD